MITLANSRLTYRGQIDDWPTALEQVASADVADDNLPGAGASAIAHRVHGSGDRFRVCSWEDNARLRTRHCHRKDPCCRSRCHRNKEVSSGAWDTAHERLAATDQAGQRSDRPLCIVSAWGSQRLREDVSCDEVAVKARHAFCARESASGEMMDLLTGWLLIPTSVLCVNLGSMANRSCSSQRGGYQVR